MDTSSDYLKKVVYSEDAQCKVDGCKRLPRARGLCDKHYARWRRHGDPTYTRPVTKCSECNKNAIARGLCRKHYYQKYRSRRKRGRKWKNGHGYINMYLPDHPNASKAGRIKEHVFVMSEHLGRPLKQNEQVHHKNGIKDDNRIENLELWTRNHPTGSRVADLVEWCVEFLEEYGTDPTIYGG